MRKLAFLLTALALAAVPAVSLASPPNGKERANAARLCKAQRAQLGSAVFTQKWGGGRNAYGKCVSSVARTLHQNASNAAQQCRAEQNDPNFAATHGGKTFAQFYGTNADLSNAFANCVQLKLQLLNTETGQLVVNPARLCRAQRSAMGAQAFAQLYGTNANKRNAFGRCVSKMAHLLQGNIATATQQCRAEQNDPNFPASHGGKTFIQFYGTNANGSDAFLNCVLQKLAQLQKQQQAATVNAAQQCKAEEKQLGVKQFKQKYGSFGNCVSQKSKQK